MAQMLSGKVAWNTRPSASVRMCGITQPFLTTSEPKVILGNKDKSSKGKSAEKRSEHGREKGV